MSAMLPIPAATAAALPLGEGPGVRVQPHDQFIVSFGKNGALGVFTSDKPLTLRRGQKVLVQSSRGVEVGSVLRPATLQQARLLGATSSASLLRAVTRDDEIQRDQLADLQQRLFDMSRNLAQRDGLTLEILDVDVMFDRAQAIIQFVGIDADTEKLASALELHFAMTIRLENLSVPKPNDEHEHGGCDKPDCGRTTGGGCSTCGTGGGCSTCGSGKTDLREYFGHLRTKMESRTPLVTH